MTLNLLKNLDVTNVLKILRDFDICSSILGAKYLFFFSSRSLKTREKYISFAQFVYFLREVRLLDAVGSGQIILPMPNLGRPY